MSIWRDVDRGAKEHSFDFRPFSVVTKEFQVFLQNLSTAVQKISTLSAISNF